MKRQHGKNAGVTYLWFAIIARPWQATHRVGSSAHCRRVGMKKVAILASVWVALASVGGALSQQDRGVVGPRPNTLAQPREECGPRRHVVEIREADPEVDKNHHK